MTGDAEALRELHYMRPIFALDLNVLLLQLLDAVFGDYHAAVTVQNLGGAAYVRRENYFSGMCNAYVQKNIYAFVRECVTRA